MAGRDKERPVVAEPLVEYAELKVDGKTYRLAYDFNAIAEAEAEGGPGLNLLEGLSGVLIRGMGARQIRALLYAALKRAHPKITPEQAGHLVRVDTLPEVWNALMRAYDASLPEGQKILADPTTGGGAAAGGEG